MEVVLLQEATTCMDFFLYPFGLCKTKDEAFGLEEELKGLTVTRTRRVDAQSTGETRTPHQTRDMNLWKSYRTSILISFTLYFVLKFDLFLKCWLWTWRHLQNNEQVQCSLAQKYLKKNIFKYRPIKFFKIGLKPVKIERSSSRVFSDFWMIVHVRTHVIHVSVNIGHFGTLQVTVCPSHSNWRTTTTKQKKKHGTKRCERIWKYYSAWPRTLHIFVFIILAQNKNNKVQSRTQPCPELETPSLRPRQECWER